MFSQTVEYALRAAAFLAGRAPEARTTDQIAVATRVPKAYLSKVLQGLSRGGVVHSQRARLCPLHKRMDNVLAQVEETFRSTTLAEILAEPSESIPLCDFPQILNDDTILAKPC
jgi:Rrf2 family nitric oxide-sensitive transcriptional repressor